ncbi:MAG: cellulase family glycosylhydrolase, partial [Nitrosopumilaceae archaeon]
MIGFFSMATLATFAIKPNTSSGVNWSSDFHGANYAWGPLAGDSRTAGSTPPATSFPQMKALGFNLISVYFRWQMYLNNPSAYLSTLKEIASNADANGISVVYSPNYNTDPPNCIANAYSDNIGYWNALLTNGANQCGTPTWTLNEQLWAAVIGAVDSYSSTLGYGITTEPQVPSCNISMLQKYHTHFGQYIRSLSSKSIVWMGPYQALSAFGVGGGACSVTYN